VATLAGSQRKLKAALARFVRNHIPDSRTPTKRAFRSR
jgi:hypothetical protein